MMDDIALKQAFDFNNAEYFAEDMSAWNPNIMEFMLSQLVV